MADHNATESDLLVSSNEKKGAMDLQFVSMNPSSQLEKQRNKKVIRSMAMKSFRRKQTSQKAQEKTGIVRELRKNIPILCPRPNDNVVADAAIGEPSPWMNNLEDLPSDASWSFHPSLSSRAASNIDESDSVSILNESTPEPRFLRDFSTPVMSIIGSPITPLGAGRVDPFRIYPVGGKSNIPELFDHCESRSPGVTFRCGLTSSPAVAILWPGLGPETQMPTAWFRKAWEKSILMHALAFGAIVHMDVLRSPRISLENPLRLFHKVQTMTLLKEEMKNPDGTALDDVILAVLALSTNEVETVANHMKEKVRSPFNSPLASIQWLDVYGSITHVKAHTLALRSLVARRGGLENVELPGLAETLSL